MRFGKMSRKNPMISDVDVVVDDDVFAVSWRALYDVG